VVAVTVAEDADDDDKDSDSESLKSDKGSIIFALESVWLALGSVVSLLTEDVEEGTMFALGSALLTEDVEEGTMFALGSIVAPLMVDVTD